ncbi:MAG: tRNA (guanine(10)-N(2))-dimethyltransferase [Candidatus Bathyarchaeia archaeon]
MNLQKKLDFPLTEIKEGSMAIKIPDVEIKAPTSAPVFYNPKMELNRDLAVAFLQCLQRKLKRELNVCEPLTGCGVRGARFASEVKGLKKIVINDINPKASALAKLNVKKFKIVEVHNKDANMLLAEFSNPKQRFDYIDIDPFGSPVPYIPYALKALRRDGVLAVTATDMAPLCGVHSKACFRHYGVKPLRTEYCHELAVRILCSFTATTAAKNDLAVKPLLCHSTDHYIRAYIQISKGAEKADESLNQLGYLYHCFKCLNRKTVHEPFPSIGMICEYCGTQMDFAGPLWLGDLHDRDTVKKVIGEVSLHETLGQKKRVEKILQVILREIRAPQTYYVLNHFCDFINVSTPPYIEVLKKIRTQGYTAVPTHFNSLGIKTDMPAEKFRNLLLGK